MAFLSYALLASSLYSSSQSGKICHGRQSLSCSEPKQKKSSHDIKCFSSERKIFNPITKRHIDQTHVKQQSEWNKLMFEDGGYIAHNGVLVPINLGLISLYDGNNPSSDRERNMKISRKNFDVDFSSKKNNHEDDVWNPIFPSLEITNHTNNANQEKQHKMQDFPMVDQLLFIDKPPKLLTLPGIGLEKADCLSSRAKKWLGCTPEGESMMKTASSSVREYNKIKKGKKKKRKRKSKPFEPRPCHRLDFDTSGVLCIGLSPHSHQTTSALFEKRLVQKTYVALVIDHLENDSGTINFPIGKVWNEEKGFNEFACLVDGDHHDGRQFDESDFVDGTLRDAKTEYFVSQRFTLSQNDQRKVKYTRVLLKPNTGRGHQLRLHMKAIGHCILGDQLHAQKYVADCTPRLCLHAENLRMPVSLQSQDDDLSIQTYQAMAQSIAPF